MVGRGEPDRGIVPPRIVDELLFREGRALGVEDNDPVVRARVVQKMRHALTATDSPEDASDTQLARWLERNRARFPGIMHYTVELLSTPGALDARQRMALNSGSAPEQLGLSSRVLPPKDASALREVLGVEVGNGVIGSQPGRWNHVTDARATTEFRVVKRARGEPPSLSAIRPRVLEAWRDQRQQHRVDMEARRLLKRYELRIEPDLPPGGERYP
mgnify:CR=1 FL=1